MAGSGTIRVSPKPERVWALLAVLAGIATILIEIPAALMSEGGYSFTQQPISHLGMTGCGDWGDVGTPIEVCSPAHPFVNGVSIIAGSMLAIIAFIWHDWIAPSRWGRCGSFLLAAGGMLLAGTGMVPADIDPTLHAVFGFGGSAIQNLGLLAAGIALIRWPETLDRSRRIRWTHARTGRVRSRRSTVPGRSRYLEPAGRDRRESRVLPVPHLVHPRRMDAAARRLQAKTRTRLRALKLYSLGVRGGTCRREPVASNAAAISISAESSQPRPAIVRPTGIPVSDMVPIGTVTEDAQMPGHEVAVGHPCAVAPTEIGRRFVDVHIGRPHIGHRREDHRIEALLIHPFLEVYPAGLLEPTHTGFELRDLRDRGVAMRAHLLRVGRDVIVEPDVAIRQRTGRVGKIKAPSTSARVLRLGSPFAARKSSHPHDERSLISRSR